MPSRLELGLGLIVKAKVDEVTDQQLADEKLCGQVVEAPLAGIGGQLGAALPHDALQHGTDLLIAQSLQVKAVAVMGAGIQIQHMSSSFQSIGVRKDADRTIRSAWLCTWPHHAGSSGGRAPGTRK